MSKASDDLRKIMNAMSAEVQKDQEKQSSKPKAAVTPSIPPPSKAETRIVVLLSGVGVSALVGLVGAAMQNIELEAVGCIGSLVGAIGLGYLWKKEPAVHAGSGASDIAVEVIRRRSLELERDRLRSELERTHHSVQSVNDKLIELQQEIGRVKMEKSDAIVRKESELRERIEQEKARLREEVEAEKKTLLEREKRELESVHQESTEREKILEQALNREISQLKQELTNREKKLSELNAEVFKLHDHIERQAEATPAEISERMAVQAKAFEEERKLFQKRLQDQELAYQRKQQEVEAGYARNRMELEKRLDELGNRSVKLQEALDHKVVSASSEAATHIEEMRKSFEQQKREQEQSFQRKIQELESGHARNRQELEKKFEELGERAVKLQEALDRKVVSASGEAAQHIEGIRNTYENQKREQEASFQKKLEEVEAGHARNRAELERKLDELGARAMKLQEALDQKVVSASAEAAVHIEEMRKTYEAQKDALQKKLLEQAAHYQKKLEGQEEQFNLRKVELLTACEAMVKELETREEELNRREQSVGKGR